MDNRLALFDGQTRYVLEIDGCPVKPDVLRFRGREALSEPFNWDIEFTTQQENIPPEEVLMKYASFRMRSGKNIYGVITRMEWLSTSRDQSHYRVTLSSRMSLLAYTRQCAVFQNQSVPEVVEQVLRKHGLEGPDFEFRLEQSYPTRELITQWQETDLRFIQRILSEVGIYWRTEMDNVRELDVFIFADSQLNYQFDIRLPYSEPSGFSDGTAESLWGVRTWHNVAAGRVTTRDYNYRTATTPLDATVSVRNDAVTTGEQYRYSEPYRIAGDDANLEPETESGAFYARIHHERELNRATLIHLFSNASDLTPGQVLEPQGNAIAALQKGVVLTLVTFRGARDTRLHVSVWGMPYSESYCFRPEEIPRPVIPGTLPARVEGQQKNDIYACLDEQGRYRVKLDFDREGTKQGEGYLWLRMAKPTAGETLGWHTPLIDGTEVAIAWSNGDIDLPYIAYALHDSEHPDLVNRDNHTQNVLRTPADSTLQMEDKCGEEHIRLSTEYGKTQLNIGHVVDSQETPRGTGLELRTDEWGTIRAGKGLFVSADGQAKAQGDAQAMEEALKEIGGLNEHLRQLEMAAEQAQALKTHVNDQVILLEQRLKPLNEAVLFSAPEGVALTSGEDLQLAATGNLSLNAGEDISAGAMGNMTALAGEKVGLFARTGQLSLKSAEGPVDIQAQNDSMALFAEKKLTLASASDIAVTGKKRITLTGGGSYLKLEQGKVEYGTTATCTRKVKKTMLAASSSLDQQFVKPPAVISEIKITSDMLLRIKGETDTEWAERLVKNKLSARFIEQKTGIPRSRIAKWPSYRAIRDQENQIKANKKLGRQKAVQLFSEKELIKHKDLIVISKKTGIPTGTLRRMDEYKARRPEKQKKAALQDKEKAKQLLKEGHSVRKIAKETNVAERTLHQWKGSWKKIKVSSDASSSSTTEQTLITQISDMKKKRGAEENIAPAIQKKMKKMLSAATDELEPYTRDCTTTAIGVDGNEKYYISSSSYPFPVKLQRWAKKNNINIIDAQGHAEESMINNVGNIKHIEPSRDVCLECEHKMLKHHVTTSTSFSHKLSRARRIESNPTEEMIELSKKQNAADALKEKNKCEAKRLLTDGKLSLAEIERDTGVRMSTMVGWQEHKTWLSSRKQLKADDPRKAEAVQMSRKGITQNEIAKKLKTSKTKVSLWIKEFKQNETREILSKPSTSGKKASSHAGGKPGNKTHMQLSLRSEIRAESGVISQRGLTRWIQEPGMNNCSYQEVLSVLEDEEIDFDVNDFIKAWTAAGRILPGE